jgi:hypothetical protein
LPNCVAAVDLDALVQKREEERGISEFFLHILQFSLLCAREFGSSLLDILRFSLLSAPDIMIFSLIFFRFPTGYSDPLLCLLACGLI